MYSELLGVALDEEVSVLLGVILIASVEVWHEIIVEVVVAAHTHKKYTFGYRLGCIVCTELVRNLVERCLEVLDLLVEGYATNLYDQ